jgi:hypothetical protein
VVSPEIASTTNVMNELVSFFLINMRWKTQNTNVINSIHLDCNGEIKWWYLINVVAEMSKKCNQMRLISLINVVTKPVKCNQTSDCFSTNVCWKNI